MTHRALASAFALLVLALSSSVAYAQPSWQVTDYQELVDVQSDGSAKVTVTTTLADLTSDTLELPLNFAETSGFSVVSNGAAATAASVQAGDINLIRVQFEQPPAAGVQLRIAFTSDGFLNWKKRSPDGVYAFSYTFANATPITVNNYRLKVLLPPGYRMSGVTSSTPRATGEEVVPPYDFTDEGGRLAVNLRSKAVVAGRTAAIAFGFRSNKRSPLPAILIGLIVILVSLYLKRDVLTREDYSPEVVA